MSLRNYFNLLPIIIYQHPPITIISINGTAITNIHIFDIFIDSHLSIKINCSQRYINIIFDFKNHNIKLKYLLKIAFKYMKKFFYYIHKFIDFINKYNLNI